MFHSDFPFLREVPGTIFLDSAASAQKPEVVIQALSDCFHHSYANIHRGSYDLSERAEALYDDSKKRVARFLGAASPHEIVYTYNATYAFNLLSRSLVKSGMLRKGDMILLSRLEHHANIVPWQILAEEYGIGIEWIDITSEGRIDLDDLSKKLNPNVKLISLSGASNVTGATLDIESVHEILRQYVLRKLANRPLLVIDGSQSFPHFAIDVTKYDIDFFITTGHKVMSDTGIGILYGKKQLLKSMLPAFCGGGAINAVSESGYEAAGLPYRYEPGTPHIAGAASLGAALAYIEEKGGYETIEAYEKSLVEHTLEHIKTLPDHIHLIGPKDAHHRIGAFSFAFDRHHPKDIADALADR